MSDPTKSEFEDEALVAEYVVGVLPVEERRALEDRMSREPDIRRRVLEWENRMEDLNDTYGQLAAPRSVKARIDRQLFHGTRRRFAPLTWLMGAATGLASAAAVAVFLYLNEDGVTLRATLAAADGVPVVRIDKRGTEIDITQAATQPPEGSVYELWLVRADEPPLSLGTFASAGTLQLNSALSGGETLAVSVEPLGGSPTGAPTGPVIATGVLQDV